MKGFNQCQHLWEKFKKIKVMVIIQLDSEQLNSVIQNAVRKVLNETSKGNNQPDTDQIFDIAEACAFLKLSKPTLYGLVSRAEIPVNKKGKRLYFSKKELTDWVKLGRKKTNSELVADAQNYISSSKKKRG